MNPPKLLLACLSAALLLSVPAQSLAAKNSTSSATGASAVASVKIDNFGKISDSYYRGSQPLGNDYSTLASLGIKTVIDLTSDDGRADEKALTERAGMIYVHMPMTTHQPPTETQLAEFLKIVNDPASQPVYVHCVGGKHRTGVMTASYRMSTEGWTADRAFQEMKQFNFGPDFLHSEFKNFVLGFHPPQLVASKTSQGSTETAKGDVAANAGGVSVAATNAE